MIDPITSRPPPSAEDAVRMLDAARAQIQFARQYTLELLDATPEESWFTIPEGMSSNVSWQVGHLTVSQYGLLLFRLRGRLPEDLELIPGKFRKAYARGSTPKVDPSVQPTVTDLRDRFNQVYELGMQQIESVSGEQLLQPVELPYATFPTVLGSIMFCPLHEHIHAGQIGMLRRSLGLPPIR